MPNNVNIAVGAGEQKAITFECGGTYNPDDIVFNITAQGLGTPLYYVEGPSTDGTAGTWTGTISGLTAYYDGLTVLYVPKVAGASTTTLNINSLGAVTCYFNSTSGKLTTHHPVGVPILLTYKGGKWLRADYANSNTIPSAYCSTGATAAAKTASCSNYYIPANTGHYVHVLTVYSNTKNTALTLNINSRGAYPIYINGEPSSASNYTLPAGTYIVYFDGSNYQFRTDGVIPGTIMNANTVNNHTVNTDVPSNAVFTDTTYGLAGNGEDGLMSAADKDKLDDCITDIQYNGSSVVTVSDGIAAISGFKPLQTAVSDPAASSTTSNTFIDSISQDTNGVITVTKKTVPVTTDTNTTLSGIAYCNTAAGTAAKTATMPGFALSSGQRIILHLATASTVASATLSVNSTAAKNVRIGGANTTASNFTEGYWLCNYDGTYWQATKIYLSDTDTKVTSSANHYTPSTASGNDKSASASGATAAWGIDVVKGVTLNTDGKGHVTGISVTSGKIPANPDTDVKVKATAKTDNVNYKILATASASPTSGNATEAVYDTDITMNPSTNTIAANISGNAVTATTAQNYDTSTGTIKTALEGKVSITGDTMTGQLVMEKPYTQIVKGTGTVATSSGSTYYPAKWNFDLGIATPTDGDHMVIQTPCAGHDYGVWMSTDNGTTYYPVACNVGTSRLSTRYPAGAYICVVFEEFVTGNTNAGAVDSVFPLAGGSSRQSPRIGCWRVVNDYDSGNTYDRTYTSGGRFYVGSTGCNPYSLVCLDSAGKFSMLISSGSGTGTSKTINTSGKFKLDAVILYYGANNTTAANTIVTSTYSTFTTFVNVDTRYSHNHTTTFTTNSPLYIECTIDDDGFWSPTSKCITQTLEAGKYYIYLGQTYSTEYQLSLTASHPLYYYDGTNLTERPRLANADRIKLDGISTGANKVEASSTNGKIKIDGTDTTVYTHPTGSGNNHIPAGGSSGQYLAWDSAGTAKWVTPTDTNTTLSGVAYCSTSAGTAAKAATMPGFALASGQRILLYLSASSTVANATLNVNSTGAKTVRISSAATTATNFTAGYWLCYYDGTYWNAAKFSIPHQEAYLEWGGKNLAGAYSPIDASMVGNLGANRTAFVSAAKVTVQYSRDAGATWTDYDTTDAKKTGFFTDFNGGFTIGNSTTSNRADENCLLRVVLATNGASVYTVFNKFVVYISTSGSNGCWCTIDARLQTNVANNVDTWAVFANHIDISGYPGYSVINTSGLTTYGNTASSQYGEVRFTFGCTSHTSTQYAGLQVYGVNCYGGFGWNTPSTLAKNGHLYSYDMGKNATFPAKVTATGFVKSGGTSAQFLKADGSVDTNTYSVSTHTHGNITNAGALQSSDITIANGDKLVVTDASDSSKVAGASIAFDGSTTTQFLSKKGTWETDSRVTQTVTASTNTSYRPLILGKSYSDAATFSPTTVTDVTYATHLAKFAPSTGILAVVGLNKMTTSGTVSAGSNSTLWNTNGGTTSIATVATSGSYSDLSNTPTNLSDFTNDSNFITDIQHDGTSVVTVTDGVAAISGFKTTQTAVSDPTASSTTSTTFIDSISQDTNGVITATKKTLPTATSSVAGIAKLGASGGSAAYSHTHGNITSGGALQTTDITIANGDKLVVTDASSSSKVARTSVAFDGSTTTQALTKKGTFETFLQSHQDISGKEDTSNKVSSWSSTTTNEHYPSEKLVKDSLDLKAPLASPALTGTPTAPTADAGTNTTQVATTAFVKAAVDTAIADVADALIYKGTIAGGSTGNYGALTVAANKGDLYKVSAAGKVNGVSVEVGDMLICNSDSTAAATSSNYTTIAAKWDVIQTNIEGYVLGPSSSVNNRVAVFDGTTGKTIKDSGYTIATSVPSGAVFTDTKVTSSANHYTPSTVSGNDKSASASGATAAWGIDVVKGVTLNTDGKGHVTGISVTSGKIPSNPDTNTTLSGVAFCNTAAGTAAKTATMPGFALSNGQRIILHLATASTVANATLNVNSTTAKTVMIDGAATTASNFTAGYWLCNYDGTYWQAEKVDFTDTKVTSSANHYTPATASGNDKSASASGGTAAWSIDVVKGVTLNTDGKGHVTGISVTSGKIPSNPNTDTKVKATAKTDNVNYKILATASASPTSGNATEAVYDTDITLNPSTNTIAANISGDAATASAAKSGSTLATTIAGKQDALTTQTAYTSKGSATKVPQITTNSLGQVTGITEVTISGVTPAAHNHSQITTAGDNRSVATAPNDYSNKLIFQGLKTNSVIGSPTSDTYSFVVGLRGWSDSSGGNAHELAFNNTGLFIRRGATTAWGNWEKVLTSANIPTATSSVAGITTVGASDGAAAYEHTHDNYITDIYHDGSSVVTINNGVATISGFKTTQTAVSDPTASSTTSNTFIDSISQDTNGVITVTKKTVPVTTDTNTTLSGVAYCNTTGSTKAKVATMPGFALSSGQRIILHLATASTVANATLNVNSTAAKTVKIDGANTTASNFTAGYWLCNYDGSYWQATKIYLSDTDTKVTSSANHYTPATASGNDKSASASGATAAWSIDVVKGVTLNTDGKGHVTGISVTSGKIPSNPNTDTKVTQTYAAASGYTNWRPLVVGNSNSATEGFTPSTVTDTTFVFDTISCQPSSGTIRAGKFKVSGGTSSQFLKADGSTDSNGYIHDIVYNGESMVTVTDGVADISGFKPTQTAVSDPTASGTSTTFISTLSQDANGVISVAKASLPTASSSVAGITKVGASGGAAAYNHSHSGYKTTQTAVSDPTASSTTSTTFIDSISQDTNGVITVTKKTVPVTTDTNTTLSGIAYCNTGASTAAKTATMPGFALSSGQRIILHLATASTVASATLNVNSTGAKTVKIGGANTTATNFIAGYWTCNYDGTNWVCSRLNADVKQGATTIANYRKILLSGPSYGSAAAAVSESTDCTYQAQYVEVKPSTGELRAKSFVKASPTNATGILLADGTDIAQSTFATAGHTHSGYKTTQTAVSDPTASSTTSNTFIDSISQDTNGVITVTKKTVPVTTDTNTTLSGVAYCDTAGSTKAKAATMPGFALSSGQRIILHLVNDSTVAAATLSVNSTTAKNVRIGGANTTASNFTAGYWLCNYDGTYWQATKIYLTDTTYPTATSSVAGITTVGASGGAAAYSHTHSYLPLSGGTMTGNITMSSGKGVIFTNYTTSSSFSDVDRTIPFSATGSNNISLTSTDSTKGLTFNPATGALKTGSFVKLGGTSSQFLKADGSTDSNSYIHDIQYDGASVVTVSDGVATISGFKTTQTAVSDPTASSTTSTTFIDSISQDTNGVITVTKKTVPVTTDTNTTLSGVAYCDTAAATAAKTATMPGFALSSGQRILMNLVTKNSATSNVTLNVNGTGAVAVKINGSAVTSSNFVAGYWICEYNGTNWNCINVKLTDTDYIRSGIAYCETTASTAAKTAVLGGFSLYNKQRIILHLAVGNTATNATLNVGSTAAKPIRVDGVATTATNLPAGYYLCDYDNTNWNLKRIYLDDPKPHTHSEYITGIYYDGTSIATVSNGIADISGAVGVSGGLAAYSHSHSDYVAKTGDTMTGDLTISESGPAIIFRGATSGKQEYRMLQSDSHDAFKIQNRDRGSSSSYTDMMWVKKNFFYLPNLFVAGTDTATSPHVLDMYAPNMNVNRLFGLPASCIIIEVSQDGGTTWQDGGFTDSEKKELLTTDMNVGLEFPKKNGANSTDTRMRITITNCKYNVPDGTPETQKYSYWNNTYYDSTYFRCPFCGFRIMYYTPGKGNIQIYTSNMFSPDTWTEIASKTGIQSSSEKLYICPTDTKYMYANINSPSYAHHIRFVFTPTTVNATYAHAVRMIEMYAKFMGSATGSSSTMMTYGTPYRVDKDANMVLRNGTTTPPKLIFERGSGWDAYWDWAVYAKSNGALEIGYSANGNNWSPVLTTLTSTGSGVNVSKLTITNGTSSQFLKADGTLDSNVYVKRPSAGNGTSGQVLSTNGDGTTSWVSQSGGSSGYDHGSSVTQNGPNDITVELGTTCDSQCAFDVFDLDSTSDVNMNISIPSGAYKGCHTFIFVNSDNQSSPAHTVTIQPRPLTAPAITMINPVTTFTVYPIGTQQGCHYVVVKIYYDTMAFPDTYSQGVTNEIDVVRIEILNHSDLDMALNS